MIRLKISSNKLVWILGVIVVIALAACAPEAAVIDVPPTETAIETEVPTVTEAAITPTTPVTPSTVLLVSGDDIEPHLWMQTQSTLARLAEESGLDLVNVHGLTPDTLTPAVKVVVGVGQTLDLNTFASNAPNITFVALGDPNAVVTDNLSVIGDPVLEVQQQAFMAGYVSALIASDSKIAALVAEESAYRDFVTESYVAGARFFCGLCQPLFPPYNPFPQWETLPVASRENGFTPTVDRFAIMDVEVVYVQGELLSPELLTYLDAEGMKVVSDRTPDVVRRNWIGTIAADPTSALEALWPDLQSGAPGRQVSSDLVLIDREMGLVSEGRYRLFADTLADLRAGLVSVGITP
ncbi:MAG: hypothetical protein ACNA70_00735 [Brevefilum sp.]